MIINAAAATAFYVVSVMCSPSFAEVNGVDGIKVGTRTYCILSTPSALNKRQHPTREGCEAALRDFLKPEDDSDLERKAMDPDGYLVAVCHEDAVDFPFTNDEEGEAARRKLVDKYGPKGDGV